MGQNKQKNRKTKSKRKGTNNPYIEANTEIPQKHKIESCNKKKVLQGKKKKEERNGQRIMRKQNRTE